MQPPFRRLVVVLIRTSRYDDDGYVVRHWRGTLPSNTLSCLQGLTEEAVGAGVFGTLEVRVESIDEIVSRVDPVKIARRFRRADTKTVVGLVGVQTNQFPRASDLARQFRHEGLDVIIGGFHVSGSMAMSPATPPECQALLDEGVTLVLGEVEGRWAGILQDALGGRLQAVYNYLGDPPDLSAAPLPRPSRRTQKRFVMSRNGTIDAGRGCPFACSFCTIINVQGRTMRARRAGPILEQVRRNYWLKGRRGVRHYFFTDDNFSRNPEWEAIFDGLAGLRDDGLDIDFMIQVDTQAARIPRFVEKAARAGCVQVFIGVESIRDDNLVAGAKVQNRTADFRAMFAKWHAVGVVCHAGVIIGFPNDTYERVMEDVRTLAESMLVDQASFFMLTPLPGSRDHLAAVQSGVALDPDLNNYDAFHAAQPHPRMSREEWTRAFHDAWTEFYSVAHMRRVLLAQNPHTYWPVLKTFLWYRAGMVEGAHPMVTGLFRLKDRTSRRPTFPVEGRWRFAVRRANEIAHVLHEYLSVYGEMQDLWLSTRIRRDDYWFLGDLRTIGTRSSRELKMAWGRIHAAVAARIAAVSRLGSGMTTISATLAERVATLRDVLGNLAPAAEEMPVAPVRPAPSHVAAGVGSLAATAHEALAGLRLPDLAPVRRASWVRRTAGRLNPFALDRMEPRDPPTVASSADGGTAAHRTASGPIAPLAPLLDIGRSLNHALAFLVAMHGERY